MGSLICELIGQIKFRTRRNWVAILLYTLCFIFMPLICLILSFLLGGGAAFFTYKKLGCFKICMKSWQDYIRDSGSKLLKVVLFPVFYLVKLIILLIFAVEGIFLGSLIFAIFIVPFIVLYIVIMIRKSIVWRCSSSNRPIDCRPPPAKKDTNPSADPVIARPDIARPDIADPDTLKPDTLKPDTVKPGTVNLLESKNEKSNHSDSLGGQVEI